MSNAREHIADLALKAGVSLPPSGVSLSSKSLISLTGPIAWKRLITEGLDREHGYVDTTADAALRAADDAELSNVVQAYVKIIETTDRRLPTQNNSRWSVYQQEVRADEAPTPAFVRAGSNPVTRGPVMGWRMGTPRRALVPLSLAADRALDQVEKWLERWCDPVTGSFVASAVADDQNNLASVHLLGTTLRLAQR